MSVVDTLSLEDSDSEFSGFELDDIPLSKPKVKSKVVVSTKSADKSSKKKNVSTDQSNKQKEGPKSKKSKQRVSNREEPSTSKDKPIFDVSKLSANDLNSLKEALGLGLGNVREQLATDHDIEDVFGDSLSNLPNIQVSLHRDDLSEGEIELDYNNNSSGKKVSDMGNSFSAALFDEPSENIDDSNLWQLPKLRAPEKGPAIIDNLANLVNTVCSVPCDTDAVVGKYKIPENCTNLGAPLVNNEIWKILDKRARSQDRGMTDIQNLLSAGMVSVIQMADLLKPQIQANKEAKQLMADVMTIIGQVQYQLSVRRRYLIRPNLNKKYTNLCNVNTPISSCLFGDDISKEIKSCDAGVSLGKDLYRYRGRGYTTRPFRGARRSSYVSSANFDQGHRYTPYPQRGQFRGHMGRPFSQRGRRFPSATVTSEQTKN